MKFVMESSGHKNEPQLRLPWLVRCFMCACICKRIVKQHNKFWNIMINIDRCMRKGHCCERRGEKRGENHLIVDPWLLESLL